MARILDQSSSSFGRTVATLVIVAFLTSQVFVAVSARYLPTRSQDDRLEKLRELLRDLLEGDLERRGPSSGGGSSIVDYGELMAGQGGRPQIYKRSTNAYAAAAGVDRPTMDFLHRHVQQVPDFRKSLGD